MGVGQVVVTLGENGSFYKDRSSEVHIPALNAGNVVETTGAGDAYNGALATSLAKGSDILDAIRFATATAAISVTRPGAASSMPDIDDINDLLSDQ